ncbi:polysaccharide biosynthesis tyrosine autokinase [Lyngbya sp. CCY1209]|uniref:GumC family protein n=1 Tax=Lyngbya sp. CCY1209 TaxID=2886103 RepID=UPI002D20E747|nr:polysaccharide biosynthesis tyrosine autokinase [Lyngbya sp. CCY1209]MEB3883234.1 polysaccharide biosynthesis tyrosine autokinase [Lyngbya sp. CCY1209]
MNTGRYSKLSIIHPNTSVSIAETQTSRFKGLPYPFDGEMNRSGRAGILGKIWRLICRRALVVVGVTATATAGAYFWTVEQTPEYRGTFQLLMTDGNGESDEASQLKVLQSPKLMADILETIQTRYPEVDYRYLFNRTTGKTPHQPDRLSVAQLPGTQILEVGYRDAEPQKIQFILDAIAAAYLEYGKPEEKPSPQAEQLRLIDNQIAPLESRIASLKKEIVGLQQQYGFIDPEIATRQLGDRAAAVEGERLQTQAQLAGEQSRYAALQQQLGLDPEQAMMASALTQSPRYRSLLEKLLEVETEVAFESARFKEKSPQIQALLDQRNQLLPLLREEAERVLGRDLSSVDANILAHQDSLRMGLIEQLIASANQIQMLQVRDRVLERSAQQLEQYAATLPEAVRRHADLNRELQSATARLDDLSNRKAELQLTVQPQTTAAAWEAIAPPTIPRNAAGELRAVSPNLPLNLLLGGSAGLALGLVAARGVDRLNNVFRDTDEVAENTPIPLLGVIPASDDALMLPALPQGADRGQPLPNLSTVPCGAFHEAFRSLSTNLSLLATDSPVKSCAISSACPADGKSTVAFNLALGTAAMGRRVLVVDADLRNPRLHSMLGVSNESGLSDAIARNLDVKTLIRPSHLDENLSVLTSGPIPVDPTRMLSSSRMREVMQELGEQFDLIIYDTAPLLGLADANLLASRTDGLMMVVGLGKTDRAAFDLAMRELEMAGVPILGMVANGDRQERNYYYSQAL